MQYTSYPSSSIHKKEKLHCFPLRKPKKQSGLMLMKTSSILYTLKMKLTFITISRSNLLTALKGLVGNSKIYWQMESAQHWNIHYGSSLLTEFDFPHVTEEADLVQNEDQLKKHPWWSIESPDERPQRSRPKAAEEPSQFSNKLRWQFNAQTPTFIYSI